MKILFVSEDIPFPGFSGSSIIGYEYVRYFKTKGHKISIICPTFSDQHNEFKNKALLKLKNEGYEVNEIRINKKQKKSDNIIRRFLNNDISNFYPLCGHFSTFKIRIDPIVHTFKPDFIFSYGFSAIYLTKHIKLIPRFAPMCEHPYLIYRSNWKNKIISHNFRNFVTLVKSFFVTKKMASIYNDCLLKGHSSNDFLKSFEVFGVKDCKYYNHPLTDYLSKNKIEIKKNKKFKIILIGALSSVNRSHYLLLKDIIIPGLELLMPNLFEVHLIGSDYDKDFEDLYNNKNVILKGYVKDINSEFQSCDILLSPTPSEYGLRVRLIEGLLHSCNIVTTVFDAKAFPIIKHKENALVANKITEIPELIFELYSNKLLRQQLANNARKSYEIYCSPDIACEEYLKDMKKVIGN